jgi:hypothetical protein
MQLLRDMSCQRIGHGPHSKIPQTRKQTASLPQSADKSDWRSSGPREDSSSPDEIASALRPPPRPPLLGLIQIKTSPEVRFLHPQTHLTGRRRGANTSRRMTPGCFSTHDASSHKSYLYVHIESAKSRPLACLLDLLVGISAHGDEQNRTIRWFLPPPSPPLPSSRQIWNRRRSAEEAASGQSLFL